MNTKTSAKLNIAIIGCGNWSQNIIRNIRKFDDIVISYAIDSDIKRLQKTQKLLPYNTQLFTDYNLALADEKVNAILIITPISTHYQIAKDALKAKKHVYVQKPCTEISDQAVELNKLAQENKVKLFTAFTYCYHSVIKKLFNLKDELGEFYYYDSTRINLGLIQRDVNVLYDLFCHDAAILYYLTEEMPEYISATGQSHNSNNLIDVANISLGYKNKFVSHCHENWISPIKNRTIILAGEKKMATFDDCSNHPLKIYDTGFKPNGGLFDYRVGDVLIPKIEGSEAIFNELKAFFDCIIYDFQPLTNGDFSVNILKMIEAANKSMVSCGEPVSLA